MDTVELAPTWDAVDTVELAPALKKAKLEYCAPKMEDDGFQAGRDAERFVRRELPGVLGLEHGLESMPPAPLAQGGTELAAGGSSDLRAALDEPLDPEL